MKFIQIILENSTVKEAKLYSAAKKASDKPDTGITVNIQSAYHVIKDSATIAYKYLPLFIFGQYQNPFLTLKKKFKREDIEEFLASSNSDFIHHQLLTLILNKIDKKDNIDNLKTETPIQYTTSDNPYGEYDYASSEVTVIKNNTTNISILDSLCEAFDVI
jgi:hypothetical protein